MEARLSHGSYRGVDDTALLAACVEGDPHALEAFARRFTRVIYFHIHNTLRRVRGKPDAERASDIFQTVFTRLLADDRRRLSMYQADKGGSVATWLRTITIRTTLNALRRDRPQLTLDDDDAPILLVDARPDPLDTLLERDRQARRSQLFNLAEGLSESDRLLLDMIYVRTMSAGAIAATLGIKRSQVHVRKSRLVKRLRTRAEAAGLTDGSDSEDRR